MRIGRLACGLTRNASTGRVLILIHGGMDRMTSMRRLTRQAISDCNVIAYDRRGYGSSYVPGDEPNLKTHAEDFEQLLDHVEKELGFDPLETFLFGHSMGGVVAIGGAIGRTLGGTAVFESPIAWMPEAERTAVGDAAIRNVTDPEEYAENFMRRMIGDNIWERMPVATRNARRAEGATLVAEMWDVRVSTPWKAEDIPLPFRVGYGDQSLPHQVANAKILASLVPGSSLTMLPGVSHGAHLSAPKELYARVIKPLWKGDLESINDV